jgi:8-oxo-dGTP pyrophosphatase MutT (NUDIX family)
VKFISLKTLTEQEIRLRLTAAQHAQVDSPYPPGFLKEQLKRASVLIPLLRQRDGWHILYIRRTANQNDPHSGQVAFPGGAADLGDADPVETALREAREEIGLNPNDVQVLGRLNDFVTVTSYLVTPIVGTIPWPYPLRLAAEEVSRAFTIPLDWLADPKNRQEQYRPLPQPFQPIPVIYYKPYQGEVLWGASARLTVRLIEVLSQGK